MLPHHAHPYVFKAVNSYLGAFLLTYGSQVTKRKYTRVTFGCAMLGATVLYHYLGHHPALVLHVPA